MSYNDSTHVYSKDYTPTQNLWANIYEKWPEPDRDINQKDIPQLYDVLLSILTEREVNIVKMRCGLGRDPMTYSEIGKSFGISLERARQILVYSFRKLRDPRRSGDEIKFLFATLSELQSQVVSQKEKIQALEKALAKSNNDLALALKSLSTKAPGFRSDIQGATVHPGMVTIKDLDFSKRTCKCLTRSGLVTVADVLTFSDENNLRSIRNFGDGCFMEVKTKLNQYGIILKR